MYIIYIMSDGNIHTLTSINKKKLVFRPKSPRGAYPKDKDYYKNIKLWFKIAEANKDIGIISVMPTQSVASKRGVADIRDEDNKVITWGVRSAVDRPAFQLWNNDKMREWCKTEGKNPPPIESGDYGIATLVSGGIGVLDFDCEKDWNWFLEYFHLDLEKYIITSNVSKHNCGCDSSEDEKTYHLWFKIDDYFNVPDTRVVRCIYNGDGTDDADRRHIDFLQQARNGTPQVVKIPSSQDARRFISKPEDLVLNKLPAEVSVYFKSHWVISAKEKSSKKRSYKYVEICRAIPNQAIIDLHKKIRSIYTELYGIGVDNETITELALEHLKFAPYVKIKHGADRDYSVEETIDWINSICSNYRADNRSTYTIDSTCKEHNIGEFMTIQQKWLNNFGNHFDNAYLHDVKHHILEPSDRKRYVNRYYNHFFIKTTGSNKNGVYFRKYDNEGSIVYTGCYQTKSDFTDYCGCSMILQDGGKEVDTASWWFKNTSISYDKIVFQPYGICKKKYQVPYDNFNAFTGYKMKYINDYKKPELDEMGDIIDKHLREVLSWDNKVEGGVNDELYNYLRAWFYKHAVLGERTKVSLVFYSKEKGTGKSLWIDGYRKYVIGDANSLVNGSFSKMTKDTFTDYYENLCLLVIEEMPDNSSKIKEAWDFMKTLTTDDKTTARKFQTAPDKMDLHCSNIILTNHFYAIDKEFADRRMCGNRVSSHRKNDVSYFDKLAWACDCKEGWENWVHRYLIQKHHEFSNVRVMPTTSLIPNTLYRKELMRRGNDLVLYFLKDLMERMENPEEEDPYQSQYGKHLSISGLYEQYESWKRFNHIDNCIINTTTDFTKRLTTRYEFKIIAVEDEHKGKRVGGKVEGNNVIKKFRSRRGNAIIFDKEFIETLKSLITHNTLSPEETIIATEQENNDSEIDIGSYFNYNELSFLD